MKRVSRMNNKAARQFSTLCLSGALTLGAFGEAQAAGNDAALQALLPVPTTGMKNPTMSWRWNRCKSVIGGCQ